MKLINRLEEIIKEKIVVKSNLSKGSASLDGKIETESGKFYFLKSGEPGRVFFCEENGIKEIAAANVIKTPTIVATEEDFILMEFISREEPDSLFFNRLGRSLAKLHKKRSKSFGFYEDNFIGGTPQMNIAKGGMAKNWTEFYFEKRILFQFKLAESKGLAAKKLRDNISRLESVIGPILDSVKESPSLLHGDLWSGNYLCNNSIVPVLIDPAVYYGHREADLAMTRLFGGFPPEFYQAYNEEFPLEQGWQERENIYRLYHVLNHLNLFGTGYLYEAETLINYYICRQ